MFPSTSYDIHIPTLHERLTTISDMTGPAGLETAGTIARSADADRNDPDDSARQEISRWRSACRFRS
ncbi:protein of unknown function [Nitrospira japonica]|uniref:Uncharacterized protein n=1 Tax=Nitrospira japonica TaxID=1325564 RepID=A0A1W1I743_9BACT|nr:protein of unknown function [Nitrospira japonica]